jgi:hypothetical protein
MQVDDRTVRSVLDLQSLPVRPDRRSQSDEKAALLIRDGRAARGVSNLTVEICPLIAR